MLRRVISAALVAAVLLGGTACRRNAGTEVDLQDTNEERPMKVSLKLEGGLEAVIDKKTVLTRVIVIQGADAGAYQVFGIEPVEPIDFGAHKVLAGVAVVPFKGDGRYTIEPGSPHDVAKGGAASPDATKPQSSVRVVWAQDGGEPFEYLRREQPCTVDVDDGGFKGRLRCPRMTQEGGQSGPFSLDFRWERP